MIFPLTHDRGTVRRLPLVTFAIMALCVLFHFRVAGDAGAIRESDELFETAMLYFAERPYLDPDPRLVPPELTELLEEYGVDRLAEGRPTALQQGALDERTDAWLESLQYQPFWTGGLIPSEPKPLAFVTHAFLHGDWLHLFGNLLFLYFVGPFVEDRWGRLTFAGFYLGGAVVAGLGFALQYPNLFRPLVGASGAVAAVMAAFVVVHGGAKIRFFYWIFIFFGTFSAPAWFVLLFWFGGELFSALLLDAAAPGGWAGGVAYWAHVWGFVFGLVAALVIRTTGLARRLGGDDLAEAAPAPFEPFAAEPAELSWRLVEDHVRQGDVAGALRYWRHAREDLPDDPSTPRVGVRLAEALAGEGRRVEAADVLREASAEVGPRLPLGVAIKATRLADDLAERDLHVRWLEVSLANPNLPADLREEMELQRPLQ
jgi:membrane associated rhomboid family serine protease